ncbi:MAG TPA: hypothetical protein VF637_05810 [Sphingomicrobium sp.]|jgi:hypothetical protein
MNDKLFRELLNLLMSAAEDARDQAKHEGNELTRDMWSAVAGNLDNARRRMRK